MNRDPISRPSWLDRLPVVATILVAIAAGVLAADATHDVAARSGAVRDPTLAWMLPLILEGAAVTAGLLAWRRTRAGQGAWPERLVLGALVLLAVVVNASHASAGTPLGVVLAAAPPLVLVTSIELLLRSRAASEAVSARIAEEERAQRERDERRRRAPERSRNAAVRNAKPAQQGQPVSAPQEVGRALHAVVAVQSTDAGERDAQIEQMLADEPGLTGAQVAQRFGVSSATGRRWLAAARERVEATA